MTASGITPKSGIWRASYRRTLADAIIGCREEEACDAVQRLAQLSIETLTRDLERVREEVMERLGPHSGPDSQLRHAVMRTVLESFMAPVQNALQFEPRELVPVA